MCVCSGGCGVLIALVRSGGGLPELRPQVQPMSAAVCCGGLCAMACHCIFQNTCAAALCCTVLRCALLSVLAKSCRSCVHACVLQRRHGCPCYRPVARQHKLHRHSRLRPGLQGGCSYVHPCCAHVSCTPPIDHVTHRPHRAWSLRCSQPDSKGNRQQGHG